MSKDLSRDKSRDKSGGPSRIKVVSMGFAIMALALFGLQVARLFGTHRVVEFAGMVLTLLGWVLVFLGFLGLTRGGREFFRGRIAAALGALCVLAQIILAVRAIRTEAGNEGFIDFFVLGFFFASFVMQLYCYAKAFRGYLPYVEQVSDKLAGKFAHRYIIVEIILVLLLVALPIGRMLPAESAIYFSTVGAALIMLLLQLYLCRLLVSGYRTIVERYHGRGRVSKKVARPQAGDGRSAESQSADATAFARAKQRQQAEENAYRKAQMEEARRRQGQAAADGRAQNRGDESPRRRRSGGRAVKNEVRPTTVYSKEELEQALRERQSKK